MSEYAAQNHSCHQTLFSRLFKSPAQCSFAGLGLHHAGATAGQSANQKLTNVKLTAMCEAKRTASRLTSLCPFAEAKWRGEILTPKEQNLAVFGLAFKTFSTSAMSPSLAALINRSPKREQPRLLPIIIEKMTSVQITCVVVSPSTLLYGKESVL